MVEVFIKERRGEFKALIRRFCSVSPFKERYRWLGQKLLLHNYSFRHYSIVGDPEATGNLTIVPLDSIIFKGFKISFEETHYVLPFPIYDHD